MKVSALVVVMVVSLGLSVAQAESMDLLGQSSAQSVSDEWRGQQCFLGEQNCGASRKNDERFFYAWEQMKDFTDLTPHGLGELAYQASADSGHRLALLKKGMRFLGARAYEKQAFMQLTYKHRGEVATRLASQHRHQLIKCHEDLAYLLHVTKPIGANQVKDEERTLSLLNEGLGQLSEEGHSLQMANLIDYIRTFSMREYRFAVAKELLPRVTDLTHENLISLCSQVWERGGSRRDPAKMRPPVSGTKLRKDYDELMEIYRLGLENLTN